MSHFLQKKDTQIFPLKKHQQRATKPFLLNERGCTHWSAQVEEALSLSIQLL